jgi:hypothetical protein
MLSPMIHSLKSAVTVLLLAAASSAAVAAQPADSRPLVLDTQSGISDGTRGGTELRTAPLSQRGTAGAQQTVAPDAAQYPLVIAPYIEVPGGGPRPLSPSPRPRPAPHAP